MRFWGVRGSFPVPGAATVRFGGNTTCVEVGVGSATLIIDAGTGIINLGNDLLARSRKQGNASIHVTLLLTHMHHDHTQGFPFFAPVHLPHTVLNMYGPRTFDQELEETLLHAVLPPSAPVALYDMPSLKTIRTVHESEVLLVDTTSGDVQVVNKHHAAGHYDPHYAIVRVYRSLAHPRQGVFVYRIEWRGKAFVFASDTEGYAHTDQRLVRFAQGADILVHDAQYTEDEYIQQCQGWGHSTPQMACSVAQQAQVKRLVLTHHAPHHDDEMLTGIEQQAQQLFAATLVAHEGMELVLL